MSGRERIPADEPTTVAGDQVLAAMSDREFGAYVATFRESKRAAIIGARARALDQATVDPTVTTRQATPDELQGTSTGPSLPETDCGRCGREIKLGEARDTLAGSAVHVPGGCQRAAALALARQPAPAREHAEASAIRGRQRRDEILAYVREHQPVRPGDLTRECRVARETVRSMIAEGELAATGRTHSRRITLPDYTPPPLAAVPDPEPAPTPEPGPVGPIARYKAMIADDPEPEPEPPEPEPAFIRVQTAHGTGTVKLGVPASAPSAAGLWVPGKPSPADPRERYVNRLLELVEADGCPEHVFDRLERMLDR